MRRFVVRALAVIAGLVAILFIATFISIRRSLPLIDGTTTVTGTSAPIEIVRDADAIPHIFAASRLDALFGLGYVHAQDRLWQMEFQRRVGFGRLSEIFGAATVPQDRFLRTVGFGRAARTAWETTPEWAKAQVNAYVSGVNAFIGTHHGTELPLEFSVLRFEPEAWSGPDVIVWVKMMAWDLSANYSLEMLRHDLVAAVGTERMNELMPPYPADGLSILGAGRAGEAGKAGWAETSQNAARFSPPGSPYLPHLPRLPYLPDAVTEGVGSNNWVVDGTLTASGKPLLANDPHLGTRAPSTWYLAHMSAGDFDVIGATLPGVPAVALGRNPSIAWGATNVAADVEDLYRERLDKAGKLVEFRGVGEPITIVPETIVVRDARPIQLAVRITRHGPLVSDALNTNAASDAPGAPRATGTLEPLAFRWTALDRDDSTLAAFLKLNDARDWDQFTSALRDFVVPSQNFVYADVNGHIGYYAPGRIPIRASGDGSLPAEGWTGNSEWTGWIPFDDLPHTFDPPDHLIVTANHRPAPPDYKYFLGLEWPEPYRAQRITDLLTGKTKLTPDDFARIQADTLSLHAKALVPLLLAHARPEDPRDREALDVIRQWQFDAAGSSAAEAIFETWFTQLTVALVGDELVPRVADLYRSRFSFVTRFMTETLSSNAVWCDDVKTAAVETCDAQVTSALHRSVDDLTKRLGKDMKAWRWDTMHHAVFPHAGLDAVASLRPYFSRSVPNGGDFSTVNVGPVDVDHPYEQRQVPGYREIIDLSPANDSRFLNDLGESGHPMSPHYDDFLADWQAVKHRKMRMDRTEIERGAIGHLKLVPQ